MLETKHKSTFITTTDITKSYNNAFGAFRFPSVSQCFTNKHVVESANGFSEQVGKLKADIVFQIRHEVGTRFQEALLAKLKLVASKWDSSRLRYSRPSARVAEVPTSLQFPLSICADFD